MQGRGLGQALDIVPLVGVVKHDRGTRTLGILQLQKSSF